MEAMYNEYPMLQDTDFQCLDKARMSEKQNELS